MATLYEITSQKPSEFLSMTSYTLKEFEALLPPFEAALLNTKKTLEGKQRKRKYSNYQYLPKSPQNGNSSPAGNTPCRASPSFGKLLIIATRPYRAPPIRSFLFLFIKNNILFNLCKALFLECLNRKPMPGSIFSARS